jgi:hypothetical protein
VGAPLPLHHHPGPAIFAQLARLPSAAGDNALRDAVGYSRALALVHRLLGWVAPLQVAGSPDDLEEALSVLVGERDLLRLLGDLSTLVAGLGAESAEASHALLDAVRTLDDPAASILAEAIEIDRYTSEANVGARMPSWMQPTSDDPLEFLFHAPLPMARALLCHIEGSLCLFALVGAVIDERALSSERARELAQRALDGSRAALRLVASLPGSGVPDAVVPPEERLDLATIHAAWQANEERVRQLASGQP